MDSESPEPAAGAFKGVGRGALLLSLSRVVSLVVTLASTAVLARLLTPADFGAYAAMFVVLALPYSVFEGAFGSSLLQKKELTTDYIRASVWFALAVSAALYGAIAAAAPLVEGFFRIEGLREIMLVSCALLPFKAVTAIATALLLRRRQFGAVSVFTCTSAFVGNIVVAIPLALLDFGVWSLVWGVIATAVVDCIAGMVVARPAVLPPRSARDFSDIGGTNSFFGASQILNWAALYTPSVVIGRLLGDIALGLYSRSWRLMEIATSLTAGPLQRALITAFADVTHDIPRARASFMNGLILSVALFGVTGVFAILAVPVGVRILFGPQWDALIVPTQILFAGFLPRGAYKFTESLAIAFGRARRTAAVQLAYLGFMAAGALLGANWGIVGVAVGVSAAQWFLYGLSARSAAQVLGLHLGDVLRAHLRPIMALALIAAVGAACSHVIASPGPLIKSAVGVGSAFVVFLILAAQSQHIIGPTLADARTNVVRWTMRTSGTLWRARKTRQR